MVGCNFQRVGLMVKKRSMLKSGLAGVVGCLGLLMAAVVGAQTPPAELSIGMYRISAEVAASYDSRARGLMGRETMPANAGMVFVYEQKATHCMWMRNTLIPLSVAFLDDDGAIINIAQMTPQSDDSHCATRPARYALEMNAGWFSDKGFGAGDRIKGLERLPAAR